MLNKLPNDLIIYILLYTGMPYIHHIKDIIDIDTYNRIKSILINIIINKNVTIHKDTFIATIELNNKHRVSVPYNYDIIYGYIIKHFLHL